MFTRKHFTLAVLFLLFTSSAIQAQGWGVQLGFIQNTTREKRGSDSKFTPNPTLNGFKTGIFHEHDFYKGLGISYGLNYSFLADQTPFVKATNGLYSTAEKSIAQYIDLPIGLQYKLSIAQELYLVFNVGPTLSYGITNDTESVQKILDRENVTNKNKYDNYYQRFDILLGGSIGIQYKKYQIRGGYDWGLLNLFQTEYDSSTSQNLFAHRNEWNIRLIYNF